MSFHKRFLDHIDQHQLFTKTNRVLLAVSGGVDSMVMVDLFQVAEFPFGMAHCNFRLRGEESDEDERFLMETSSQLDVAGHFKRFDTRAIAQESRESIQMVARRLRYEWLEQIRQEHQYDYIATAHHVNDSIETIIFNWSKGTGIKGLLGVPVKNDKTIRPLLFATKDQIETYADSYDIAFREDRSNKEDKYSRNKIRHHIIPVLKSINPNLEQTASQNIQQLNEINFWFQFGLTTLKKEVFVQNEHNWTINLEPLRKFPFLVTPLFEWLAPFGFNQHQIKQLVEDGFNQSGNQYFSSTHQILVDRACLIIAPIEEKGNLDSFTIYETEGQIEQASFSLKWRLTQNFPSSFDSSNYQVYFNPAAIKFPMQLRRWQPGDRFTPLGMKGKSQKIQDFFSTKKLNRLEKAAQWILTNEDGTIIWLVGHRISEKVKISEEQNMFWSFSFNKK